MAKLCCDFCSCLFNFKPPNGAVIEKYKPVYCGADCKKRDEAFLKYCDLAMPTWRVEK